MRYTDAVITNNQSTYATTAPALNLAYGGMNGFVPRIGSIGPDGKTYQEWMSSQPYVRKNVIPILLNYPRFFDFMPPNNMYWVRTFKAIMEQHPLSIDGLNQSLTVETDSFQVGAGGAVYEEITRVTRTPSTPTFVWNEKAGEAVTRFFEWYLKTCIMNPDTQMADARVFMNVDDYQGIVTPDFKSFSMLFLEPDPLGKVVNRAWLIENMTPKPGTLEIIGSRDLRQANGFKEVSIEFTALDCIPSIAVNTFATRLLQAMKSANIRPDFDSILPVTDIDPTVMAADTGIDS